MTHVNPTGRAKPVKKQHGIRLVGAQTVAAHLTMCRANVRYFTQRGLFEHKSACKWCRRL
jgi:hypothetical protein